MSTEKFSKENSFSRVAVGRRVREVRAGLTYQAFADRLGVSAGFVSEIEHGRKKPSAEMLFALESQFGVDVNWLLRGGERHLRIAETAPRYGAPVGSSPADLPLHSLDERLTDAPHQTIRLPRAFAGRAVIAVSMVDDSMAPVLPPGAVAGVDRARTTPVDGALHLVSVKQGGRWIAAIRRLYRVRGGIRLRAEHERFGDVTMQRGDVKVAGSVTWILKKTD